MNEVNAYDIKSGSYIFSGSSDNINQLVQSSDQTLEPDCIYLTVWAGKSNNYHKVSLDSYIRVVYNLETNIIFIPIKIREDVTDQNIFDRIQKALSGSIPETKLIIVPSDNSKYNVEFYIYNMNYNDLLLGHAVINHNYFKEYFYMDESDICYALKKKLKLFYKGFGKNVTAWVSFIKLISTPNQSFKAVRNGQTQEFQMASGTNYIKVIISRANSNKTVQELYYLIPRLLKYFDESLRVGYEELFSTYVPGFDKYLLAESEVPTKKTTALSNIKIMRELDPDLVPKKYAKNICQCQRQPKIISADQVPEWNSKVLLIEGKQIQQQVMAFPPDNPKWYIVCTNPQYPFPGVKPNPYQEGAYPALPCCFGSDQMSEFSNSWYNIYYRGYKSKEKEKKKEEILKVGKTLAFGRIGELPKIINILLKKYDQESNYYRLGLSGGNNSLLSCILDALSDREDTLGLFAMDEQQRNMLSSNFRSNLLMGSINPNVMRQEFYDFSEEEIMNQISNPNVFLDPALFYRSLEEYFKINIYVFVSPHDNDVNYASMETPRHKSFHARSRRENRYSILIFKYWDKKGGSSDPKCDLIIGVDPENKRQKLFDPEMAIIMNDTILNTKETINWTIDIKNIQPTARRNIASSVDYYSIISSNEQIKVREQLIDGYGKCRGFIVLYKNVPLSIIVHPCQPENLPVSNQEPPSASLELVMELLGTNVTYKDVHNNQIIGLWYPVLDIEEGIYCPIISTPSSTLSAVAVGSNNPYYIKGRNEINRLRKLKRTRDIILQLSQWLYILYRIGTPNSDLRSFLSRYLTLFDPGVSDSADIYNFDNIRHILPKLKNIDEGLDYLSKICPTFIRNGKVLVYSPKLMDGIIYYLEAYQNDNQGKKVKIPIDIKGLFVEESDFKQQRGAYIFIKESDLKTWIISRSKLGLPRNEILTKLSFDYNAFRDPYFYRAENGSIYMIQNVINMEFVRAINVAYTWYISPKINLGYEAEPYRLSDETEGYPRYVLYELGSNGGLIPTKDMTENERNYLKIFKYGINQYAAVLPWL